MQTLPKTRWLSILIFLINKIKNIYFNNCRFECVSDQELPNFRQHGAADWDRKKETPIFKNVENIVLNNTVFSE